MPATLVAIPYSPWSRRTILALRALNVEVHQRGYLPVVSEVRLRLRLRRPWARVTVPVLFRDDGPPLDDSFDIVQWAASQADPDFCVADLHRAWNERAERALVAGRLRTSNAVLQTPRALRASLPPAVARLGSVGDAIGRDSVRRVLAKYDDGQELPHWESDMANYCRELRSALDGRDTLFDRFTYADVTAAVGLAFVSPSAGSHVPEEARACWTHEALASEYADLLSWRDEVVARCQ